MSEANRPARCKIGRRGRRFVLAAAQALVKITPMLAHRRTERSSMHHPSMSLAHSTLPAHRRQCLFSGRVQGVGFRYTVKNIALQHNISGYVRNLPDGRVELVME